MSDVSTSPTLWEWIAGALFTAWNGLLTLILGHHMNTQKSMSEDIKAVANEREEHCIPRNECERTHRSVDDRLTRIETGIAGIHSRLDKAIENRKNS